jgi:uncharacterized membrane protein (DUF373 family)
MRKSIEELKARWPLLNIYEKFEQVIAIALIAIIAVIIVLALVNLGKEAVLLLFRNEMNPFSHNVFQTVFGEIMTLLIALEFRHSIVKVVAGQARIIQVKTVLLVALLAIARKFIILETETTPAATIAALAAAIVAIGVGYWLISERERGP